MARSQKGGVAYAQGNTADDGLCVCIRCHHGAVSVVYGQDPGVGVLRPDFGLEKVMTIDAVMVRWWCFGTCRVFNPDLRWYIVHAYSGMEKAVERNIT
jgi:hypothetical protein